MVAIVEMENISSQLKVTFIAATIMCLLFCSGFLVFFTPFPLFFVFAMYDRKFAWRTVVVSLMLVAAIYFILFPLFYGITEKWSFAKFIFVVPATGLVDYFTMSGAKYIGLTYFAYFTLLGVLFGEGMTRKWPLTKWFAVSVGSAFLLSLVVVGVWKMTGVAVYDHVHRYMQSILNELIRAQEASGSNASSLFAIKSEAEAIVNFSIRIIPSVVFLFGLTIASLNQLLARWIIRRPEKFSQYGDVARFSVPQAFVWVTIGLGFLFFFNLVVVHNDILRFFAINGLIVFAGIYFLQGLIILSYLLRKIGARWLKLAIYVMIFLFIQFAIPIVALFGFSDLWIDFRRIYKKELSNKRRIPWK